MGSEAAYLRPLVEGFNTIVSLALAAIAFALLYRYLPAVPVDWREAAVGGAVTSVLFTVGSWLLSRYLGSGNVTAGFGAASALVVLLVFVHYSAQIVLFGAEFAHVYGTKRRPVTAASGFVPASGPSLAPAAPTWAVAAFLAGLAVGLLRRRK